jgi:uncharacterized repeat protein (TIGR03803 family)
VRSLVPCAGSFKTQPAPIRGGKSMEKLRFRKMACIWFVFVMATAITLSAQTFSNLFNFNSTDGSTPGSGSLVQGFDGNLYGTTELGGAYGYGNIYKITPGGVETSLYSFCAQTSCPDGSNPSAGLLQASDGNFYGATERGGANDQGTVFKITPKGFLTTLYSFCSMAGCADGEEPQSSLIQASNGNLYGTTFGGSAHQAGTVYQVDPAGVVTTLISLQQSGLTSAQLVQASNGVLYGTTRNGGAGKECDEPGCGSIFSVTTAGEAKNLYSFCNQGNPTCPDGAFPIAGLTLASNGNLYGTTSQGGDNSACAILNCGTVFEITPKGTLTTLHAFDGDDGSMPYGDLLQGTDGNLYGTTSEGGTTGGGTIFKISTGGLFTSLYSFDNTTGGEIPYAGLVQSTNGNFYGTTHQGSGTVAGTVFTVTAGLRRFVKTSPDSGAVGAPVTILGTNLTGATGVTFNGVAAAFTVVSGSEIATTVPTGTTTGWVEVALPNTTLKSDVRFQVQ